MNPSNFPPGMPAPRRRGHGCLVQLLGALALGAILFLIISAVFTPWAFYMGGHFHWLPSWQGVGRLHSNSSGGDYAIYLYFYPQIRRYSGPRHVAGQALLCTPRGEKFSLTLGGDFGKPQDGWNGHDLNGKTASFYMFNRTAAHILSGASPRPDLELRGRWSNPDLVLDDHSSIQRNFNHDARLYPDGKTRPYMGEISPITLRESGKSDFDAACAAMKAK